jgi:hypothetical protein
MGITRGHVASVCPGAGRTPVVEHFRYWFGEYRMGCAG